MARPTSWRTSRCSAPSASRRVLCCTRRQCCNGNHSFSWNWRHTVHGFEVRALQDVARALLQLFTDLIGLIKIGLGVPGRIFTKHTLTPGIIACVFRTWLTLQQAFARLIEEKSRRVKNAGPSNCWL